MEDEYAKLSKINLDEIIDFFGPKVKTVIAKMNVSSLGELIEIFESKEFITTFIRKNNDTLSPVSRVYQEMLGTIKILKLKYLSIDPNFSENDSLEELGFSTRAITAIVYYYSRYSHLRKDVRFYVENNKIELIDTFSNKEFMTNEFTRKSGVGKIIGTEIYLKTNVLKDYFNVQKFKFQNELLVDSDNGSDFDLKQLYQQLDELLNQHKKISEQIEIVQHIIAEKMSIEDKNGTIEKK